METKKQIFISLSIPGRGDPTASFHFDDLYNLAYECSSDAGMLYHSMEYFASTIKEDLDEAVEMNDTAAEKRARGRLEGILAAQNNGAQFAIDYPNDETTDFYKTARDVLQAVLERDNVGGYVFLESDDQELAEVIETGKWISDHQNFRARYALCEAVKNVESFPLAAAAATRYLEKKNEAEIER